MTLRILTLTVLLVVDLLNFVPGSVVAQEDEVTKLVGMAIENVTLIDVEEGATIASQTILIVDGKITEIGAASDLKTPEGYHRVEGKGKYVIPGLWDMHIHWFAQPTMELFPINGVTGVRVMWGNPMHHQWRKQFEAGDKLGPRMLIASTLVDGPDPYWAGSRIAKNAEDGAAAVEEALAAKADFVKVYTLLPREAYLAIAAACQEKGLPFAGHVPRMVSAIEASELGQRSMEHLYEIALSCSSEEAELRKMISDRVEEGEGVVRASVNDKVFSAELNKRIENSFDPEKANKLFQTFKENETWQCPTLTVLRNLAYINDPVVQENENLKFIPKGMRSFIAPTKDPGNRSKESLDRAKAQFKQSFALVKKMHEAGVPLIAGTDVLNPHCLPGFSLHDELKLMVEAGLSPAEALRTATINPARFCEKESELGTVSVGKQADLVLLNANPLEDIANTTRIESVFLRGKMLDRTQLDELLEKFASQ